MIICMARRSCSQTTSVICFSAHKHGLIVPFFLLTSNKILIIFNQRGFIIKSNFHNEININMKTKHSIFPWGLKIRKKIKLQNTFTLRKIKRISIKTEYSIFPWDLNTRKINPPIFNFLF